MSSSLGLILCRLLPFIQRLLVGIISWHYLCRQGNSSPGLIPAFPPLEDLWPEARVTKLTSSLVSPTSHSRTSSTLLIPFPLARKDLHDWRSSFGCYICNSFHSNFIQKDSMQTLFTKLLNSYCMLSHVIIRSCDHACRRSCMAGKKAISMVWMVMFSIPWYGSVCKQTGIFPH